jgi:uncharacterized membrane protein
VGKPPERKQQVPAKADPQRDDIAEEVTRRIGSLVQGGQRNQVIAQMVSLVTEERFSGPIAHPKHLREYDEICPGAADRIISMAERNMAHHHSVQTMAVSSDISDARAGLWFGFAALVALIAGAAFSVWMNNTALALAFLGTGAIGTIAKFIRGRNGTDEES